MEKVVVSIRPERRGCISVGHFGGRVCEDYKIPPGVCLYLLNSEDFYWAGEVAFGFGDMPIDGTVNQNFWFSPTLITLSPYTPVEVTLSHYTEVMLEGKSIIGVFINKNSLFSNIFVREVSGSKSVGKISEYLMSRLYGIFGYPEDKEILIEELKKEYCSFPQPECLDLLQGGWNNKNNYVEIN